MLEDKVRPLVEQFLKERGLTLSADKTRIFRGGDIGTLAVNGTVNDLAMCGARSKWLSAGIIIRGSFEQVLGVEGARQFLTRIEFHLYAQACQLAEHGGD